MNPETAVYTRMHMKRRRMQNLRFVQAKGSGFRVRGSGSVFSLNPGMLNPGSWHLQGFCK